MSERKSDIFAFFQAMNEGDFRYVDNMSDDEVKGISPYVLTMWVNGASTNNPEHVLLTNHVCNGRVFSLSNHPRLLLKLFVAANSGLGNDRYKFKKASSKKESKTIKWIAQHYQCGYHEALQYETLLDKKDLKELESVYG